MQGAGDVGTPAVANEQEERSKAAEPAKREKKQRKKRGGDDKSAADLYGDSVQVSASDGFVEDGLAWDEMA